MSARRCIVRSCRRVGRPRRSASRKRRADRSRQAAGRRHTRRAQPGDQGRRLVAARSSPDLGRTRLFPAFVSGLRPRRRKMPDANCGGIVRALHPERPLDLLVPEVPEIDRGYAGHSDATADLAAACAVGCAGDPASFQQLECHQKSGIRSAVAVSRRRCGELHPAQSWKKSPRAKKSINGCWCCGRAMAKRSEISVSGPRAESQRVIADSGWRSPTGTKV